MVVDISWLGQEAKTLHDIFGGIFYGFITTLLLLGVFVEYAILLHSYSEVTNTLAGLTDALAERLGDLNNFQMVLSKMADKLGEMSASWVSVKETLTVALSFVGFFVLYFSVYVAEGIHLFAWTLCYVFSPLLIALFVLPATSGATKALYRTLFEIACWKIVWSTLATLLWSTSVTNINQPGADVNFVSVICLNLLLASSLLATPWVVHAMATTGLAGFSRSLGAIAVGTATITPGKVFGTAKNGVSETARKVSSFKKSSDRGQSQRSMAGSSKSQTSE
ncbi:MAG: hypothetical protein NTV34_17800 [Proteobacteria bacterium]|nr:hypothetical protein [Pseudomonadota bacterium]